MAALALPEHKPMGEMNTTPLIDVLLVLLVMILIVLPPPRHAVKIDTPFPCPACENNPLEPALIVVEFDGSYTWNGIPIDRPTLEAMLAAEARRDRRKEIHIQPDRLAEYGDVIHVMATAQREGLMRIGVLRPT